MTSAMLCSLWEHASAQKVREVRYRSAVHRHGMTWNGIMIVKPVKSVRASVSVAHRRDRMLSRAIFKLDTCTCV